MLRKSLFSSEFSSENEVAPLDEVGIIVPSIMYLCIFTLNSFQAYAISLQVHALGMLRTEDARGNFSWTMVLGLIYESAKFVSIDCQSNSPGWPLNQLSLYP